MAGDVVLVYFCLGVVYLLHSLWETYGALKEGKAPEVLQLKAGIERLLWHLPTPIVAMFVTLVAILACLSAVFIWPFYLYADYKDNQS